VTGPKRVYNAGMRRWVPAVTAALLVVSGCDGLSEFRTSPGEVYQGRVIGGESNESAIAIRSGFPGDTVLALTFDPAHAVPAADDTAHTVGTISTYTCDDGDCSEDGRQVGLFDEAELEPIPQLSHDALGVYEMPGTTRLRNYIFGARFSSGEGFFAVQRHAMVFLSLLENGRVEVRLIAPSVLEADGTSAQHEALFGVFSLERSSKP
jgi:hypothetical protein